MEVSRLKSSSCERSAAAVCRHLHPHPLRAVLCCGSAPAAPCVEQDQVVQFKGVAGSHYHLLVKKAPVQDSRRDVLGKDREAADSQGAACRLIVKGACCLSLLNRVASASHAGKLTGATCRASAGATSRVCCCCCLVDVTCCCLLQAGEGAGRPGRVHDVWGGRTGFQADVVPPRSPSNHSLVNPSLDCRTCFPQPQQ